MAVATPPILPTPTVVPMAALMASRGDTTSLNHHLVLRSSSWLLLKHNQESELKKPDLIVKNRPVARITTISGVPTYNPIL